jgi:CheY-like chemotaxis protein
MQRPNTSNTILYAEDDQNYATLLNSVLRQTGFTHQLRLVQDGAEAIAYLKGEGQYADREKFPFPCLVLADLKMPRINGFDLLRWVRQSSTPFLPVVVLTSSDERKEIHRAYTLGANSFLVKPPHVSDLKELLKTLDEYWLRFNKGDATQI